MNSIKIFFLAVSIVLVYGKKHFGEFCQVDSDCTPIPQDAKTLLECFESRCGCLQGQYYDPIKGICFNVSYIYFPLLYFNFKMLILLIGSWAYLYITKF